MRKVIFTTVALICLVTTSLWAGYDFRTNIELKPILGKLTIQSDTVDVTKIEIPATILMGYIEASAFFKNLSIKGNIGFTKGQGDTTIITPTQRAVEKKEPLLLDAPIETPKVMIGGDYKIGTGRLFVGTPITHENLIFEPGVVCLYSGVAFNSTGSNNSHSISYSRLEPGVSLYTTANINNANVGHVFVAYSSRIQEAEVKLVYFKNNIYGSGGYWFWQSNSEGSRIRIHGPFLSVGVMF
jgi:hypothetical protein